MLHESVIVVYIQTYNIDIVCAKASQSVYDFMDDLIVGRSSDKLHLMRKKVGRYLLSIVRLEIH